jgi:DNA-binding protein YbaB
MADPMFPPDPAVAEIVEQSNAVIEASDATVAEIERLRSATFQGTDPAKLVTAVVNGDGLVTRVTFGRSIGRYHPDDVNAAICAAVSAAQARVSQAFASIGENS